MDPLLFLLLLCTFDCHFSQWPACISTRTLSDTRRQELSREKLLSKLLVSVQAFAYSCCCEAYEVKRLYKKERSGMQHSDVGVEGSSVIKALFSTYGISGLACDDHLVLMQKPLADRDEGTQPFDGRLGKLRYLGLAVMAAAGAVSYDLVQLVMGFPLVGSLGDTVPTPPPKEGESTLRAPVAFPILFGHVLSHVVAALCATCGRARARSDSPGVPWLTPLPRKNSFFGLSSESRLPSSIEQEQTKQDGQQNQQGRRSKSEAKSVDVVMRDCDGFVRLGLLARVLQVLLGQMEIDAGSKDVGRRVLVIKSLRNLIDQGTLAEKTAENEWQRGCYQLLETALSLDGDMGVSASSSYGRGTLTRFQDACQEACGAAVSYLSNVGVIYQVLVPTIISRHDETKKRSSSRTGIGMDRSPSVLDNFTSLIKEFGFESITTMMESDEVRHIVANWFVTANEHTNKAQTTTTVIASSPSGMATDSTVASNDDTSSGTIMDGPNRALINRRLYQTEGFRVYDWPLDSCRRIANSSKNNDKTGDGDGMGKKQAVAAAAAAAGEPQYDDGNDSSNRTNSVASYAVQVDSHPGHRLAARASVHPKSASPLVAFSSRKSVPFLGGYVYDHRNFNDRFRIDMLPTSYTDLYAELGNICPDSEQTALCLICGQVLNANGKGECTKHSLKCGAGACIFFLLQECQGLIMHGGKAIYVQSPYVDSHGETPQYRGRPLNLDLDRYEIFRELWTGHAIRHKVIQERGSARQVIIPDFY